MAKLGPVFKGEAGQVAEKLSKADPNQVADSLKAKGYFLLDKYRILPEQVQIFQEKIIERGKRFVPHVVEPSFGSDRLVYVALEYAYHIKDGRVVLAFPRDVAPVQVGVYPLMGKDGLPEKAKQIHRTLQDEGFMVEYDEAGSIGRRYARADETGVPLGITIDYDTLKDNEVTIRDRDSWNQVKTKVDDLPHLLQSYFRWKTEFEQLGEPIKT
jgi:glycyl-tRNA synthetase